MGRSVNKVTLIGTLGRDPEVRFMPNGNAVANLTLATDESYNDKATGQKVEQTEWHRLVAYGRLAEIIQQYLKKGSKAYFEGKLKTREWEKDGIKRYTTEIQVNEMMMLDGRNDNASSYNQAPAAAPQMMGQAPMAAPMAPPQPMQQPGGYAAPMAQPQRAPQQAGYAAAPAAYQQGGYQQPQQPMQAPSNNFDDFDDDIPF